MTQRDRPGEKRPTYREVMETDGAPVGLFVSQEDRRAKWLADPPRPFVAPPPAERSVDPATAALAAELEERKKAKTRARIDKLKRPKEDHTGKRWNPRVARWVADDEEVEVITLISNTRGSTQMTNYADVDFTAMDGPGLVRAYCEMAGSKLGIELNVKPVTKFTDKETGVRRCQALASSIKARYEGLAGVDPDEQPVKQEDEVAAKKSKKAKKPATKKVAGNGAPRAGSKTETILRLISRKSGATAPEIAEATGLVAFSVNAVAAKAGLKLTKERKPGGVTRYFAE